LGVGRSGIWETLFKFHQLGLATPTAKSIAKESGIKGSKFPKGGHYTDLTRNLFVVRHWPIRQGKSGQECTPCSFLSAQPEKIRKKNFPTNVGDTDITLLIDMVWGQVVRKEASSASKSGPCSFNEPSEGSTKRLKIC